MTSWGNFHLCARPRGSSYWHTQSIQLSPAGHDDGEDVQAPHFPSTQPYIQFIPLLMHISCWYEFVWVPEHLGHHWQFASPPQVPESVWAEQPQPPCVKSVQNPFQQTQSASTMQAFPDMLHFPSEQVCGWQLQTILQSASTLQAFPDMLHFPAVQVCDGQSASLVQRRVGGGAWPKITNSGLIVLRMSQALNRIIKPKIAEKIWSLASAMAAGFPTEVK